MTGGWGNFPTVAAGVTQVDGAPGVRRLMDGHASLIARGAGRAYGDAALNAGAMVGLRQADHILAFDPQTGLLEIESGAILQDLLPWLLSHGWFMPVTPGTAQVSIGGMIAADVHGKNHLGAGTLGGHLRQICILLADGDLLRCSPFLYPDLFWASIGGMGLTGVILSAQLQLLRVPGAMIAQTSIRTGDLAETLAVSEASRDAPYSVAWIDCRSGGRGVVFRGEHAVGKAPAARAARNVPCNFPAFTLNRFSIAAFNRIYYHAARSGTALIDYRRFFYPLDALRHWNRLYGAAGLVQFQCVLPQEASAVGIRTLLAEISRQGLGSFLAVLKLCGAEGQGLLSFPRPGFSLALDFPATPAIFALLERLNAIALDCGGRLYLAKDSCAGPESLRCYQRLDEFRAIREVYDPRRRFDSLLARRLKI